MEDRIQEYKEQVRELKDKIEEQNQEMTDLLKYFDLIIVDTKDDLRIVNCYGPVEDLFKSAEKMFERGLSLVKAVYKITKNTRPRPDEADDEHQEIENQLNLEELIIKFGYCVIGTSLIYLVLVVKTFIFNIYAIIMNNIRWELYIKRKEQRTSSNKGKIDQNIDVTKVH